jgi:Tol biopolymer transport system component/DNA-binding winged helix-turn-helix (wHTH) protein
MNHEPRQIFSFAGFELDAARRRLVRDGEVITLHAKAFDLLTYLVENAGRVVSRDEIFDAVWNGQFVEESNLTVQISALRKILQEQKDAPRFLTTVPGKGYKFIADVQTDEEIVIENHSLSRIIIREEEETSREGEAEKGRKGERESKTFLKKISASPVRLFSPSKILAALVLLLIGGAAVWFYSLRDSRPAAAVPPSERQMTTHIFTTEGGGIPWRVAISPDGKWLAYVQRVKGLYALWLGELETSHSIQIIPPLDRFYEYLSFSPDGKNIYFTARDDNHPRWTLMRVPVLGGAVRELLADAHSAITFSPDGQQIAFLREYEDADKNSLVIADAETGKNERILLTRETAEKFTSNGLAWSPDGKIIAVGAGQPKKQESNILAIRVADAAVEKIGDRGWNEEFNLVWLKDGSGLVLVDLSEGKNYESLQTWLVAYPAGTTRQITNESIRYSSYSLSVSSDDKMALLAIHHNPQIWRADGGDLGKARKILDGARLRQEGKGGLAVAPDGRIFYIARTNGGTNVWEMSADGDNQRQVTPTQNGADDFQVSVTADNRYLVFVSNRSGKGEIWRANLDGSNLKQLTNGGRNFQSTVSPDGKWVFYTSFRGSGKTTLWRVSIDGGEPQQLTTEETSWAAVSPDGKFIAAVYGKMLDAFDSRIAVYAFDGGNPLKIFTASRFGVLERRLRWSPDGLGIIYKDRLQGLWLQNLNSGKPELIKNSDNLKFYYFAFSPDGKNLYYSGGSEMREIVIAENFR